MASPVTKPLKQPMTRSSYPIRRHAALQVSHIGRTLQRRLQDVYGPTWRRNCFVTAPRGCAMRYCNSFLASSLVFCLFHLSLVQSLQSTVAPDANLVKRHVDH